MFFLLLVNVNIIKKRECPCAKHNRCFLSQCKHLSLIKSSKCTTCLIMGSYTHPNCSENVNRLLLPAVFQMYFWLCDVVLRAFKVRKCWFCCLENWSYPYLVRVIPDLAVWNLSPLLIW